MSQQPPFEAAVPEPAPTPASGTAEPGPALEGTTPTLPPVNPAAPENPISNPAPLVAPEAAAEALPHPHVTPMSPDTEPLPATEIAPMAPPVTPVEMALAAATAPEPEAEAEAALAPGAGAPLVSGPPSSVSGPVQAAKVNTVFGVAAVVLLVITVIVVILLAILVFSIVRPR